MCNCIDKVQENLTNLMIEKNPGCEVVEPVTFQNISWLFGKKTREVLNNPVMGKYRIKNKIRKWTISMMPTFCPFCGERSKEEE
jgi:hypothetical protein